MKLADCLPAEPAFHSRDANNTTNTNRLELGVSFSSGLPGWFRSCFSSALLRISVVPHQFVSDFRPAVGARDVIFGRPWESGWATSRNPILCGAVQCSAVQYGTAQCCAVKVEDLRRKLNNFRVARRAGLGMSFSAGRGGPAGMSFSAGRPPGDTVPHKFH